MSAFDAREVNEGLWVRRAAERGRAIEAASRLQLRAADDAEVLLFDLC